jgi:ABC-type transport system involved in multi-copper enzyme maturation permease subunit
MMWLTWRQQRLQILLGAAVLAALAALMLPSGFGIASTFRDSGLAQCLATPGRDCHTLESLFSHRYTGLQFTIPLFLILPALIGVFWGAPLVAREVEQGTHRLAWTQGISRFRWAGTKVIALAVATVVGAALLSLLVSWWSRSFVAASDDRLSPGVFDLRGIVPIAYALFALAVGVGAGTLIRRTIPAMVATLGVYAGVRLAVDLVLRSHFASPSTVSYSFFGSYPRSGLGDWILSTKTLDGTGHLLSNGASLDLNALGPRCPGLITQPGSLPGPGAMQACVQRIGLHVQSTYQPGSRYWAFQGIETVIFTVLALGLLGFSLWWVRSRLA